MKSLLLTILLQAIFICSYSQIVDKKTIDDRVKVIDTTKNKSQTRLYVINGIPFNEQDSIKIDSALKSYDSKYLVKVDFVTCQQMNFPHCNGDIVIVLLLLIKRTRPSDTY